MLSRKVGNLDVIVFFAIFIIQNLLYGKNSNMAELNPMFFFSGTLNGVTGVKSKVYGKHMRRARGTVKAAVINDEFKKSIELNKRANAIAKTIKDAIDPFRENFRDGTMWGRLVGLFKRHFRENSDLDLSILEKFEPYHRIYLRTHYPVEANVNIQDGEQKFVDVEITSSTSLGSEEDNATGYLQTLIAVFIDAELKATTSSESATFPSSNLMKTDGLPTVPSSVAESNQQRVHWSIPDGTRSVIVFIKCEPFREDGPIGRTKLKGMKVLKVLNVGA
jgi:hypothetical protein